MNCYFQIEDGPWTKGRIKSMSGGKGIYFYRIENNELVYQMELWNPEVIFFGESISITGYRLVKPKPEDKDQSTRHYEVVCADVRYTKPKKEKN
jgi:hypothetical protein